MTVWIVPGFQRTDNIDVYLTNELQTVRNMVISKYNGS